MLELKQEVLGAQQRLSASATSVDLSDWSLGSADRVQMLCAWLQAMPAATTLELSGGQLRLESGAAIGRTRRRPPQ